MFGVIGYDTVQRQMQQPSLSKINTKFRLSICCWKCDLYIAYPLILQHAALRTLLTCITLETQTFCKTLRITIMTSYWQENIDND